MANTKISQLPTFTGDTTGAYLVMDNSGLTETFKVPKETLLSGYTTNVVSPVSGSWTLSADTNTVSFTVTAGQSYVMWVNGNIPNGIVNWNATVTLSNSNVPVIGVQYAWNYTGGGSPILFTSIPAQIIGTAGAISTASTVVTSTNTFVFGIQNNTLSGVTVNYGYLKIS